MAGHGGARFTSEAFVFGSIERLDQVQSYDNGSGDVEGCLERLEFTQGRTSSPREGLSLEMQNNRKKQNGRAH
jgi:hypothetical protein